MNPSRRRIFGFIPAGVAAALVAPKVAEAALKAEPNNAALEDALAMRNYFSRKLTETVAALPAPVLTPSRAVSHKITLLPASTVLMEMFLRVQRNLKSQPKFVGGQQRFGYMPTLVGVEIDICPNDLALSIDQLGERILEPAAMVIASQIDAHGQRPLFGELPIREFPEVDVSHKLKSREMSMRMTRTFDIREYRYITVVDCLIFKPYLSLNPSRLPV